MMDFKPNEFFLGLVDFTAIFLPGCLPTGILLAVEAQNLLFKEPLYCIALQENSSTVFYVVYVFFAYTVGYFLSSIATFLDTWSDKIRHQIYPDDDFITKKYLKSIGIDLEDKSSENKQKIENIKDGIACSKSSHKKYFNEYKDIFLKNEFRQLTHFFFEFEWGIKVNKVLEQVARIKPNHRLEGAINHFQWSSTVLDSIYPVAAEKSNRSMAASKFFRSLVIVFLLSLLFQLVHMLPQFISNCVWFGLALLSFREYVVQRQKSIQAAYRGIITFYTLPDKFKKDKD